MRHGVQDTLHGVRCILLYVGLFFLVVFRLLPVDRRPKEERDEWEHIVLVPSRPISAPGQG